MGGAAGTAGATGVGTGGVAPGTLPSVPVEVTEAGAGALVVVNAFEICENTPLFEIT